MLRALNSETISGSFKHTLLCLYSQCVFCLPSEGEDANGHHCAEDKEDGIDSCVDCWPHTEEKTQCKSKKKKKKGKGLCNEQVRERTEFACCMHNI